MKNKILWPVLGSIWFFTIAVIVAVTLMGGQFSQVEELGRAINLLVYRILLLGIMISGIIYIALRQKINEIIGAIKELTEDANRFREEQYIHQLRNYDIEELQHLAHAFDYMGEELSRTIRKLRHQKVKLESMFSTLEEGIIVIDKNGIIEEANELARILIGLPEPLPNKCHITHLLREETFVKLVKEGLKQSKTKVMELKLGERIVYITLVPAGKDGKIYDYLLLIKDITQLRGLEELKYQFVSNVSHELKTPLTSIQGFVETLQSGAIENKEVAYRFLNIIDIETKRLYRLIQDVLLLSEIENMDKRAYGNVILSEVIESSIGLLEEEACKKGIRLIYEQNQPLILKSINKDHVTQIIMNLLSNAVRYTDQGQVCIQTFENDQEQRILVKDTGIGIAEESIPRIFERFYRVDKGRSRQRGGTGLGLSIVKHIAKLYDITIKVESKLGEGTCFILIFSK